MNRSPEAIRNLPEDDAYLAAIAQLFLLAYAKELGIPRGKQFADYVQKGKKVSPYLIEY